MRPTHTYGAADLATPDPAGHRPARMRTGENRILADSIAKYHRRAAGHGRSCGRTWPIRLRAIEALELRAGDHVLDVGCGTGLSLPMLVQAVGAAGCVFGFDQSPAMLALARERCARAAWPNVHLQLSSAQDLMLRGRVDALLFHYTHDILRSPAAVARLLSLARPGARVAIAGVQYFRGGLAVLNPWVYFKNRGYAGAPGELHAPWDRVAPRLNDWRIAPTQFGMGYVASGRVPSAGGASATQACRTT